MKVACSLLGVISGGALALGWLISVGVAADRAALITGGAVAIEGLIALGVARPQSPAC